MKLSLLVLRCEDIEVSKNFYELFGLSFVEEKHGKGPIHYSCVINEFVFELYPNNGQKTNDNNRLGFKVSELENIISKATISDSYEFSGNKIYVLKDPDGRKVEISE